VNEYIVNNLVLRHKGALKCIKQHVKLQGRLVFITRQCAILFIRILVVVVVVVVVIVAAVVVVVSSLFAFSINRHV